MTTAEAQITSKTAWQKAKTHTITLPSGTAVEIQLPNMPLLIKAGDIPNHLLDVAVKVQTAQTVDVEMIQAQADLIRFLIPRIVVKPAITEEDVESIPYEDIEMLMEFANRQRDFDAVGHHLAGLETSDQFRKFRGLDAGDADFQGI